MKVKRTIETINATYDILDLSERQFKDLLHCYEKQMYIYCNRQIPENDELLNKLKKMAESNITIF